jgi:hypothetical protein
MLKILTTTALLAASTALFAQPTTPAPGKGEMRHERFDCSKAKDPKACEERREKAREAFKKARGACEGKQGDERRDCMRKEMCASAKDPGQCESRVKQGAERRQQMMAACKDKKGDELRACIREQRGSKK